MTSVAQWPLTTLGVLFEVQRIAQTDTALTEGVIIQTDVTVRLTASVQQNLRHTDAVTLEVRLVTATQAALARSL